jgi:hypothetical protein
MSKITRYFMQWANKDTIIKYLKTLLKFNRWREEYDHAIQLHSLQVPIL